MPTEASGLTERQKAWMASVRGGLQRETGKSMEEWVAVARTCPETKHRARLAWFKAEHGLGQNRASMVIHEAFGDGALGDGAAGGLWTDPALAALLGAVKAEVAKLPDVVTGQRKGFTAFSREFQFAAARPLKGGGLRLGLAVPLDADPRLQPRGRESWSERLLSKLDIATAEEVASAAPLLEAAAERS